MTGAASGIGRAVCEMLLARWDGVMVGAIDVDGAGLAELDSSPRVLASICDVSDRGQVRDAFASFGTRVAIVGLVNAAGNHLTAPSLDLDEAGWRSILSVHLDGSFFAAQAAAAARS